MAENKMERLERRHTNRIEIMDAITELLSAERELECAEFEAEARRYHRRTVKDVKPEAKSEARRK